MLYHLLSRQQREPLTIKMQLPAEVSDFNASWRCLMKESYWLRTSPAASLQMYQEIVCRFSFFVVVGKDAFAFHTFV